MSEQSGQCIEMTTSTKELTHQRQQITTSYSLSDGKGLTVKVLALGGTITSINFKGKELTLGYDDLVRYQDDSFYLGATIGRYANRIANGTFVLGGQQYTLSKNNNENCLHGGASGFNDDVWQVIHHKSDEIKLYLLSPDKSQGFPGNLEVWQTIHLKNNQVSITYEASSDKDTVVSLTNHCYFNLNSNDSAIADHHLQLFSTAYLPVNEQGIPIGTVQKTASTCFDFEQSRKIQYALADSDPQVKSAKGIDHCFVIPRIDQDENKLQLAAKLYSTQSQINLSLYTTLPGLQVYTGNYLSAPFQVNQGVCLEAQHWPDAPNRPEFPSPILFKGEKYQHKIIYAFSVEKQPIS